jgi:integrase
MKDFDDNIRLPTQEELEDVQKENPDVNIVPMDEELFKKGREGFLQQQKDEEEFPILKTTPEGLDFFAAQQDLKKSRSLFIQKLEYTPIKFVIEDWLKNLHGETRRNYAYYITDMMKREIIPEFDGNGNEFTVGHFNYTPHERVIDFIKTVEDWSEGTRQVRAACYISFTSYLSRISQGWFRKAEPSTLASNKTFYSVRDKCETKALTLHEWHRFIEALYKINERDALIAKAMLQGAKRISEVLSLRLDQIDFERRLISFRQSKTGGTIREIPITYPESFMSELTAYIENSQKTRGEGKTVFVTNSGKQVYRTQLNATFEKASNAARLPRVTPHVLRASWVTLAKEQGIPDSEVMKVTGHTSSKMIYAYDKTSAIENYSKKLVLI